MKLVEVANPRRFSSRLSTFDLLKFMRANPTAGRREFFTFATNIEPNIDPSQLNSWFYELKRNPEKWKIPVPPPTSREEHF
jgi:hypothetical protein